MRRSALKITGFTQQTAAVRKTAAARFHRQQHNYRDTTRPTFIHTQQRVFLILLPCGTLPGQITVTNDFEFLGDIAKTRPAATYVARCVVSVGHIGVSH